MNPFKSSRLFLKYAGTCIASNNRFPKRLMSECMTTTNYYQLGDFSEGVQPYLRKKRRYKEPKPKLSELYKNEIPIIRCKNSELNHYRNMPYDKFDAIPLCSKGWGHYKSKGDYFTINIYTEDYEVKSRFESGTFDDTGLDSRIIQILRSKNICAPSQIQELGIPNVLDGKNTLLAAETGTGKTIAFVAPIVHQILNNRVDLEYNSPLAVIITPSRELADQLEKVVKWFEPLDVRSKLVLGGSIRYKMMHPNYEKIDILVATIGALSKLTTVGVYSMKSARCVVLDEADTLLDDSFNELVVHFLKKFKFRDRPSKVENHGAQMILCSATMPTCIPDILGDVIDIDSIEKIKTTKLHSIMPHVPQKFIRTGKSDKPTYLLHVAKKCFNAKTPTIIFCNKSETVEFVHHFLIEQGIDNVYLNGHVKLSERQDRLNSFLNGEAYILVCSDIASRGLDTQLVKHVINYDFPFYMADYIHRCGRTGRMGSNAQGQVTSFISGKNEVEVVKKIEHAVRTGSELPNVNANIKKIINIRHSSPAINTAILNF